jgi:hypothetical protein
MGDHKWSAPHLVIPNETSEAGRGGIFMDLFDPSVLMVETGFRDSSSATAPHYSE